ncbi:sigma-E factor regulatory protein RseB [Avibacterium avium]|uniref:Sigma-E factor regulatory protein rseB n=1 Tax=Avibacterium volantium TaxID=762 RepID=A0A3S5DJ51_AVIVO|nr:sigma-E factor regulatory protein RseB [Avibacterium volantium]VEB21830.1 Sigma-E factor regulatory protein rseB precursor [Avibacterium volantium]
MLKTVKKITALSLVLFSVNSLWAAEPDAVQPRQLLDEMQQAGSHLNYEIAFVQTTPNMASLRYSHIYHNGKTYAQLLTLDGMPQQIVQRDNVVSYFQPNYSPFSINANHIVDSLPAIMWSNLDALKQNYDFTYIGRNRVADRVVQTIRILPKDDFRYQYVVFIDEQSHLLLRSDVLDRENNLLEQFRVVNLYQSEQFDDLLNAINHMGFPALINDKTTFQPSKEAFNWQPSWLPNGFKLINRSVETNGEERIEAQLYSDGLFSFTLYRSSSILPNEEKNGWWNGTRTFYSETFGDNEFTLVGQLPISTAKRIVQDIKVK